MLETGILLTRAQLEELTGMKQPARMVAWLEQRHWVYEPAARRGGIPRVSRQHFEARMSGKSNARRRNGPRLDFFAAQ
ncbi:DUF4224 domain-containing protein [Castellaniella sp.]|uniref:DUF4224 domain-containing protein n=1 Tax=Castellaniella sp. TaxID=1955812 RepID=UPI002B0002FD|nr:DUF4224 domain-containing protein [Castellaniella sp.]